MGEGEKGESGRKDGKEGKRYASDEYYTLKLLQLCTYNAVSIWTTHCHIAGTLINAVAVVVCVSWRTDAAVVIRQVVAGGSIQTGVETTLIQDCSTVLSLQKNSDTKSCHRNTLIATQGSCTLL